MSCSLLSPPAAYVSHHRRHANDPASLPCCNSACMLPLAPRVYWNMLVILHSALLLVCDNCVAVPLSRRTQTTKFGKAGAATAGGGGGGGGGGAGIAAAAAAAAAAAGDAGSVHSDGGGAADESARVYDPPKHTIVLFVVGGVTPSELRAVEKLRRETKASVIVGSTSLMSPARFLNDLRYLSSE